MMPDPNDGTADAREPVHRTGTALPLVVGIGASAGGIPALGAFFSGLDGNDLALIVVQHLAPDVESSLTEILSRSTALPVHQVAEPVTIGAGRVYVIPPGKDLELADDVLRPIETTVGASQRAPVDHFFRTLADVYDRRAVAVLLSGTGAAGMVGARRVHEQGGLVLAQSPGDAEFAGMPSAVIEAGFADVVAPAEELARDLLTYRNRADRRIRELRPKADSDDFRVLAGIFTELRSRTGHDFTHYKRPTVLRRLERRMHVVGADDLPAYLERIRRSPDETDMLQRDLLISVTHFFRDPESFEVLEREAIPALLEGKGARDEIRVWVPGCATGEEAYSIAMLLLEGADERADSPAFQVFASDLAKKQLSVARAGVYPASIAADVSRDRLARFFRPEGSGYRVTRELRETVLFAPHDLIKDPPFSKLDLVSCRNVLIYLQRPLQDRVLRMFHYALRRGGYLFLGPSEGVDGAKQLYAEVDKKARLYLRENAPASLPELPIDSSRYDGRSAPGSSMSRHDEVAVRSESDLHAHLRAGAAAPSVLVGRQREVVHMSGAAADYLGFQGGGAFTQDVTKLVAPALQLELRTALHQTFRHGSETQGQPTTVAVAGSDRRVRLRVRPARTGDDAMPDGEPTFAIVFFEMLPDTQADAGGNRERDEEVVDLERQVMHLQEQLQVIVDEYETQHEEYKSAIEELQSINEELRSTAEELETSREEAQSASEELQTVNDEMKGKVDELDRAHSRIENMMISSRIATLFLDRDLQVVEATPLVRTLFGIEPTHVGRPFAHVADNLAARSDLVDDAARVLETLAPAERELPGPNDSWLLTRLQPYRTREDRIEGVVVTFVDISRQKQLRDELERIAGADRAS